MRRVKVPRCPDQLAAVGSPGAEEREEAIEHFADPAVTGGFSFTAYQHDEVRDALQAGFDFVCAYCEAQIDRIEIEHYRPKGAIDTAAGRNGRGYYWLAASWENLLPSCHGCNARGRTWSPTGERGKAGKGSWFPLADETRRATAPGEEAEEEPLLLRPYRDDPSQHLEFREDGVVVARCVDGAASRRGKATIDLLGLNRHGLPDVRRAWITLARVAFEKLRDVERQLRAAPGDPDLVAAHARCFEELSARVQPRAGFSAATAQFVGLVDGGRLPPGPDARAATDNLSSTISTRGER